MQEPECFRFGDLETDFARGEVRRDGNAIELTAIEFKLLCVFVKARGRVLSREQLIDGAFEDGSGRAVSTRRFAIKVLQRTGRTEATARVVYLASSAKLRRGRAAILSFTLIPSMSSIAKKPCSSSISWTVQMFGWLSAAAAWASRRKRSRFSRACGGRLF